MPVIQSTWVDSRPANRGGTARPRTHSVTPRLQDYERAFSILERCASCSSFPDLKEVLVEELCRKLGLRHVSLFAGATFQSTFSDPAPVLAGRTAKMFPEYRESWYRHDVFSTPAALRMLVATGVSSSTELAGPGLLPPGAAAYVRQFLANTWDIELAVAMRLELAHGHTAMIGMFDSEGARIGPYEVAILRMLARQVSAIARGLPTTRNEANLRTLSPRQREVARLVAEGLSNSEIAETLSLAEDSVKKYVTRILYATGCRSRMELALLARSVS